MVVLGIVVAFVVGGVLGYWIGRRGKQELRNALDTLKSKIPS